MHPISFKALRTFSTEKVRESYASGVRVGRNAAGGSQAGCRLAPSPWLCRTARPPALPPVAFYPSATDGTLDANKNLCPQKVSAAIGTCYRARFNISDHNIRKTMLLQACFLNADLTLFSVINILYWLVLDCLEHSLTTFDTCLELKVTTTYTTYIYGVLPASGHFLK